MCRLRADEIKIKEPYATIINTIQMTGLMPDNLEPATKSHLNQILNQHPLLERKIEVKAKPTIKTSKYTIYQLLTLWLFFSCYASLIIGIIYA